MIKKKPIAILERRKKNYEADERAVNDIRIGRFTRGDGFSIHTINYTLSVHCLSYILDVCYFLNFRFFPRQTDHHIDCRQRGSSTSDSQTFSGATIGLDFVYTRSDVYVEQR